MRKLLAVALLLAPAAASAQDVWGINAMVNTELGTKDIGDTVAGVINVILGFLGILATGIILLGGFKWMTSQGNTDKVDEAKKLIGAGVIGLIIVLVALAVSRFILFSLRNETL